MLEEVGVEYELRHVDFRAEEQKSDAMLELNPMGKLPILEDGDALLTESAAIGLYLADRYAPGRLAPALDDPQRATYLRWSCFPAAVIEPGLMAKAAGWKYEPSQAGWGTTEAMLRAMQSALDERDYVLGDAFSMADVILGGTVRFMLQFGMLEPRKTFKRYAERLSERPAFKRADERNQAVCAEKGLTPG